MKIEKRGNSYRIQPMIDGKRYSITLDHKPTKAEIKAIKEEYREEHKTVTFKKAADSYIASKSNVLSPSTIRGYEKDLRMISDSFKVSDINDISQMDIQMEINALSEDHSPKTVRNVHGLISAILRQFNPQMVINTTLPKKCKNEPYIPTDDDIVRILEYLQGDEIYAAVALACYGLRKSEIMALTLADLDDCCVTINKAMVRDKDNQWIIKPMTKTEASCRKVYISPILADYIRQQGFIYNGSENALNRHLHVAQNNLDIPTFSLHKLRHYYASKLSTMTDDATVMALGGWSSDYVMKSVYRHSLSVEEKRKQIGAEFGAFLFAPR